MAAERDALWGWDPDEPAPVDHDPITEPIPVAAPEAPETHEVPQVHEVPEAPPADDWYDDRHPRPGFRSDRPSPP
ncbi:hypothetical protein MPHLCCUG_02656 [Mycolicibacterium phlei]|uniref:hypothetical protein n=1 Tax=Mycolicibacterium phlei TaxID=1771 RepID=UPI0007772C15|nr:hypothetical protein [Mycolicibacterium phlei]AMO61468.1 hypothetical protein MPHLCCUG_02656 [Mycolicibacterium phlei]